MVITVKELKELCDKQIKIGNGDKKILISGDDKLMLVCNPEGYNYARYVLIPAETYVRTNDYTIEQVVSDEELKRLN